MLNEKNAHYFENLTKEFHSRFKEISKYVNDFEIL